MQFQIAGLGGQVPGNPQQDELVGEIIFGVARLFDQLFGKLGLLFGGRRLGVFLLVDLTNQAQGLGLCLVAGGWGLLGRLWPGRAAAARSIKPKQAMPRTERVVIGNYPNGV